MPRKVIGSVNLTEFFVTVVTSVTLILTLGIADLSPVIPLILGGLVVAPFAGYLVKIVPARWMMLAVGMPDPAAERARHPQDAGLAVAGVGHRDRTCRARPGLLEASP